MLPSQRISEVRSGGDEHVLVLDREDIRWLCGFSGSVSRLVVSPESGEAWCIVDGRYVERANDEIARHGAPVQVVSVSSGESMDDIVARLVGGAPVLLDARHVSVAQFEALRATCSVTAGTTNIRDLRRVKTTAEIDLIARAASIADEALQSVVSDGLCGRSESTLRNRLDFVMRDLGAEDVAFDTIVASGPNGARPHHEPGDRVVEPGDAVVIDMGARVGGYRSDMTRTVMVGTPDPEIARMRDLVAEAQSAAVAAVRDGVPGRDVDAAARSVFEREGLAHEYLHSTGHGVGLAIHEEPILGPSCTAVLREGEVVTAEPGLYRVGVGGVRIEDLLVVTCGSSRLLTLTPKDLSCPPSRPTI